MPGNKRWSSEELELLHQRLEQEHSFDQIEREFQTLANFKPGIRVRSKAALERKCYEVGWHPNLHKHAPEPVPIPVSVGVDGPSYEELLDENKRLRAALHDIRDIAMKIAPWTATINLSDLIREVGK